MYRPNAVNDNTICMSLRSMTFTAIRIIHLSSPSTQSQLSIAVLRSIAYGLSTQTLRLEILNEIIIRFVEAMRYALLELFKYDNGQCMLLRPLYALASPGFDAPAFNAFFCRITC